jgi:hypothetical protein
LLPLIKRQISSDSEKMLHSGAMLNLVTSGPIFAIPVSLAFYLVFRHSIGKSVPGLALLFLATPGVLLAYLWWHILDDSFLYYICFSAVIIPTNVAAPCLAAYAVFLACKQNDFVEISKVQTKILKILIGCLGILYVYDQIVVLTLIQSLRDY